MYKLLLILKYLRRRRIAWVSLLAVMLCTTMVLVVISVMGGWLRMFRASFQGLTGDIIVSGRSIAGFDHYEEIIRRAKELPEVSGAVPTIQTFGIISINGGMIRDAVQVMGLPIDEIGTINKFPESLWRQHYERTAVNQEPLKPSFGLIPGVPYAELRPGDTMAAKRPGMIVGVGVIGMDRDENGKMETKPGLYEAYAQLEVLPFSDDMANIRDVQPATNVYWLVDASWTKVWQYDQKTVYVPLDTLQRDLQMNATKYTNADTNKEEIQPARVTEVQIKVKPGISIYDVKPKIQQIVYEVTGVKESDGLRPRIAVRTWDELQKEFLAAIENEKGLVTFLFSLISIVAVFLIFCIFYMIVAEKTKDIGIIKSVGATDLGVAGIFLGYGAAIGIVGGGAGFVLSYLIVHNINEIHTWLGKTTGLVIWSPKTYQFDTIPNTMNPNEVMVIVGIAILSSILGALIPAMRAAWMNPVEALRFE